MDVMLYYLPVLTQILYRLQSIHVMDDFQINWKAIAELGYREDNWGPWSPHYLHFHWQYIKSKIPNVDGMTWEGKVSSV